MKDSATASRPSGSTQARNSVTDWPSWVRISIRADGRQSGAAPVKAGGTTASLSLNKQPCPFASESVAMRVTNVAERMSCAHRARTRAMAPPPVPGRGLASISGFRVLGQCLPIQDEKSIAALADHKADEFCRPAKNRQSSSSGTCSFDGWAWRKRESSSRLRRSSTPMKQKWRRPRSARSSSTVSAPARQTPIRLATGSQAAIRRHIPRQGSHRVEAWSLPTLDGCPPASAPDRLTPHGPRYAWHSADPLRRST